MILGVGAAGAVELIPGGTYPAWCDRCMSSAAIRILVYVLPEAGPVPVGLWYACQVCDPVRFGDDDLGDGGDSGLVPA